MLLHKGKVSFDLISVILDSLEHSVGTIEEDRQVRKKFNNILTESVQNIGHHASKTDPIGNTDLIMVLSRKRFYKIVTGNLIPNNEVETIREQLEKINAMDTTELRAYYKQVMAEEDFSDKGTAGLGFIDMARKTGQKLDYKFFEMDHDSSYFSLSVKIKKKQA